MTTDREVIEAAAVAMQKMFPLINSGVRDGKWGTWPIEIEVFQRTAKAALEAAEEVRREGWRQHLEDFYKSGGKIIPTPPEENE